MVKISASVVESYIPKRKRAHVVGVSVDSDGLWVWGDSCFFDPSSGSHTVHADTLSELRRMLSDVCILPHPHCF